MARFITPDHVRIDTEGLVDQHDGTVVVGGTDQDGHQVTSIVPIGYVHGWDDYLILAAGGRILHRDTVGRRYAGLDYDRDYRQGRRASERTFIASL